LYPVAVIYTKKKWTLDDAAGCSSSNSSAGNSTKRSRFEEDEDVVEDDLEDRDSRITFHNYPLLIDIYEDSETMAEKVCVCVSLPSGVVEPIQLSLLGSGPASTTASISYTRPKLLYTVDGLFSSEMKVETGKQTTSSMIMGLKGELKRNRSNVESIPMGTMEITLPIAVQTDPQTISYKVGKNSEGVIVLIAKLSAFHSVYSKKKTVFDISFADF
jgi:hypothetical protein